MFYVIRDSNQPRRILVIDDDEDTRDVYEAMLSQDGHFVTAAGDATRAIALLENCIFDVALIDIGLQESNGYDIARTARQRLGARTPILIAVSGFARSEDRAESARAGFDAHLAKPVDRASLAVAVTTVFRR